MIPDRKVTPPEIEAHVLLASARRCALCYGFEGNLERKKGQIAHIDQDRSNAVEDNLVYLCMDHHDEYDSQTSQAKGITEAELRHYKTRLIAAIESGEHARWDKSRDPSHDRAKAIRSHDERLFREADDLLSEGKLRSFLEQLSNDHSYWLSVAQDIDRFRAFFVETGNQFIDERISSSVYALLSNLDGLLGFLALRFFVFPKDQRGQDDIRLCMQPNMNIDRGTPDKKQREQYNVLTTELRQRIKAVLTGYKKYRMAVKETLVL